jgi:hypothetical protein
MKPKYYITTSSKDEFNLYFPSDEDGEKLHRDYLEDEMNLKFKYYHLLRERYGIYATNQGQYVKSIKDLNDIDSRNGEELYQRIMNLGR